MLPLYLRHGLSLFVIVLLLAGGFVGLLSWGSERYHQEVTQQLHRDLASYVADHTESPIFDSNGRVDHQVLKAIAMNTMMINPSVEVYLLDPSGKILGHALPDIDVTLSSVSVEPILRYLNQSKGGPVFGANPRAPEQQGIFSAVQLYHQGHLKGYLYIQLASQVRKTLAQNLADSYVQKITLAAALGLVGIFVACAWLAFRYFSAPLRHLSKAMRDYRHQQGDPVSHHPKNEVEELNAAFVFLQARVQEQFDQLARNETMRRELVTNISHDLRTPLAAMQGYIETLLIKQNDLDDVQRNTYLEIAHRHGRKLAKLVSQLFELAKLDSGQMSAKFERFSITELISDLSMEYQVLADKKNILLALEVPSEPLFVQADIALIERVIQNLLDNAIQHTPQGGRVCLSLSSQGQGVGVELSDSGKGIHPEHLPFVFDRYFQSGQASDEASVHKPDGAGLGLNIVKKILDLHHAAINIHSEVAKGTCIRFELAS